MFLCSSQYTQIVKLKTVFYRKYTLIENLIQVTRFNSWDKAQGQNTGKVVKSQKKKKKNLEDHLATNEVSNMTGDKFKI